MQGTMGKGRKVEDMDIVLEELSIWLGSGKKKVPVEDILYTIISLLEGCKGFQ